MTPPSPVRFDLVTHWHLDAPVEAVWAALVVPEAWPSWWNAVKRVALLAPGDGAGLGAIRRMTWATALPFSLTFDLTTTRIERPHLIEGRATGELVGIGRWTLEADGDATRARYDWQVEVTKPWMRTLAPLLRPVFTWNHHVVMGWGEDGLRRKLARDANERGH